MRSDLNDLRIACRGYPRSEVVVAVHAGLRGLGNDRSGMARLIAAWLLDDDFDDIPPPLTTEVAQRIRRELRRRVN